MIIPDLEEWTGGRTNLTEIPPSTLMLAELMADGRNLDGAARRLWAMIGFWHVAMPDLTIEQVVRLIMLVNSRDKQLRQEIEEDNGGDGYP